MQNKKIFGTPMSVARRIEQEVNNSNLNIIALAFERMYIKTQQEKLRKKYHVNEDWHKRDTITGPLQQGCGCIYCVTLARYVNTKISAHRLRKRIDNLDWDVRQPHDTPLALEHLSQLDHEWSRLRAEKNQIKSELGM